MAQGGGGVCYACFMCKIDPISTFTLMIYVLYLCPTMFAPQHPNFAPTSFSPHFAPYYFSPLYSLGWYQSAPRLASSPKIFCSRKQLTCYKPACSLGRAHIYIWSTYNLGRYQPALEAVLYISFFSKSPR